MARCTAHTNRVVGFAKGETVLAQTRAEKEFFIDNLLVLEKGIQTPMARGRST